MIVKSGIVPAPELLPPPAPFPPLEGVGRNRSRGRLLPSYRPLGGARVAVAESGAIDGDQRRTLSSFDGMPGIEIPGGSLTPGGNFGIWIAGIPAILITFVSAKMAK